MQWQVVPGAKKFLEALRPYTTIAETVSLSQDFTNLKSLSRDEQQKRLRELVRRGETIAAVYAAQKLYGCGLGEAKEMIDGLRPQSGAGA
jgi:ribosomal protein L7/L12